MKAFKAREVRRPVIEHLYIVGYKSETNLDTLVDSPYIISREGILHPISSVSTYKDVHYDELDEVKLLKLQPEIEIKREDKAYQLASKLVKYLNTNKVKRSDNYDQIFTVQKAQNEMITNKWEVLPISPNACGSITSEKMRIIMDWMGKNCPAWNGYSFSYSDYNESKKRYGTSRPCIKIY
jgi:hypothetical protein